MHVVSTNLAKELFCKRQYDVMLWRHTQLICSNNGNRTPLLKAKIW